MPLRYCIPLLALLICSTGLVRAHQESTAYAIPLKHIAIDGSLEDWPKHMPTYPISWIGPYYRSRPPDGPKDLSARFRTGYDAEANLLYLAIEVGDDDLVVRPGNDAFFNNQDVCEVYLDADHSGGDAAGLLGDGGALQYVMVAGEGRYLADDNVDGNPALYAEDTEKSGVQAKVQRQNPIIIYEWAIPLFAAFPDERYHIEAGATIGFDAAVSDADGDEMGNWVSWTRQTGKVRDSSAYGNVTFVDNIAVLGALSGRVVGGAGETPLAEGTPLVGVDLLVQDSNGNTVNHTATDAYGRYQIWLQPGSYKVSLQYAQEPKFVAVELVAGDRVDSVNFAPTAIDKPLPPPPPAPPFQAPDNPWLPRSILAVVAIGILACLIPLAQRRDILGGLLLSPGSTLDALVARPDWVGPLFLVTTMGLLILLGFLAQAGQLIAGMPSIALIFSFPFAVGCMLIFVYGLWLGRTATIWLVARITGQQTAFFPLFCTVGYASMPEYLLGSVAMVLTVTSGASQTGGFISSAPTSLGFLLSHETIDNPLLSSIVGSIELFHLWSLVLIVLGLQRLFAISRNQAAIIVVVYWMISALIFAGFLALAKAIPTFF